ncbi:MAG: YaaC family protein [Candidatus Odinarchaeota archaeon]
MEENKILEQFDELESKISDLEYLIKKNGWKIFDLETKNIEMERYSIYFSPTTIKTYISNLIKYQNKSSYPYYPTTEKNFEEYLKPLTKSVKSGNIFNLEIIKYTSDDNLGLISKIIANQGNSGFNFLQTVDNIIDINKPILLFYGIEHLSSFFFNLHFNFTTCNRWEGLMKPRKLRAIRNHGLSAYEFESIDLNDSENLIELLLEKKIMLIKKGLCSRFFSVFNPNLLTHFINEEKISLRDLFINFFLYESTSSIGTSDFISIPKEIRDKFKDQFGSQNYTRKFLRSATLVIYLLSYIFSYLSRYKMHLWRELLTSNEKNISFFVRFVIKHCKDYFINFLFDRLKYYEEKEPLLVETIDIFDFMQL